jgi:hypothetical protein
VAAVAEERNAADRAPAGGSPAEVQRYLVNWRDEVDSEALYGALADLEPEPQLAEVYRRLAATEGRHAGFWEERLRASGAHLPARRPGWRTRLLIAVARRFGNQTVLPTLNDLERTDSMGYDEQPESRGTTMPAEERSHARLLQSLEGGAGVEGAALGRLEGRHAQRAGTRCGPPCSGPTTGCCRTSASSWAWPARRSPPTRC